MFKITNNLNNNSVIKPCNLQFFAEVVKAAPLTMWKVRISQDKTEFDYIIKVGSKYLRSMTTGAPYHMKTGVGEGLCSQRTGKFMDVYGFLEVYAETTFRSVKTNYVA